MSLIPFRIIVRPSVTASRGHVAQTAHLCLTPNRIAQVRRMALDRRNYRQLVDTTVELANKVGCAEIVSRIVEDLKDESEPYRRMVMESIDKVIQNLGTADIDARLEELLIDGILYAFQEQVRLPLVLASTFRVIRQRIAVLRQEICRSYFKDGWV